MIYIYVFGGFPKWGTPKFHLLSEDFQDNPFVLGIPHISTVQEDPEVPDQFTRHACVWLKSSKIGGLWPWGYYIHVAIIPSSVVL